MLLTAGIGLKIYDTDDPEWFQTGNLFASFSDNLFRSKLDNTLAHLVESGIASLQISYVSVAVIKDYFMKNYNSRTQSSKGIPNGGKRELNLGYFAQLWMQNGCFSFYSKEKCDLSLENNVHIHVKLIDFLAVWILFASLLVSSVLLLTYELIFKKNCTWSVVSFFFWNKISFFLRNSIYKHGFIYIIRIQSIK